MNKTTNMPFVTRYRRQLLATASAFVLIASVYSGDAKADDTDRPLLWIEGGWHFDRATGLGQPFLPPFAAEVVQAGFAPVSAPQSVLDYSYGGEGKISFQPEDSDWVFVASVRYGRAQGHTHLHQEAAIPSSVFVTYIPGNGDITVTKTIANAFNEISASNTEAHAIVDLQIGKDVGLGLFGKTATSTASLGLRFAQLKSTSDIHAYARPNGHFEDEPAFLFQHKYIPMPFYHNYSGTFHRESNFQGIGPSISWTNSAPLLGSAEEGEVMLDWGANLALLFGRQETKVRHKTSDENHYAVNIYPFPSNHAKYVPTAAASHSSSNVDHIRHRSVMVSNAGGFAGLSFRYSDAKLSLGYRADFFFGAVDGGVDTRHSTTRGFHGPFASISIGIGD